MGEQLLRTSELDRELDKELESDSSIEELFDDDSDLDPTYDPIPTSSRKGPIVSRPRLFEHLSDLSDDSDEQEVRPSSKRPRLLQTQPNLSSRSRQVLSDSSDSESNSEINTTDNHNRPNSWEQIDDNTTHTFVHSFAFHETPGPKHCNLDPQTSKPVDYFNLFFTHTLLTLFTTETNRYATQTLNGRRDSLSPASRFRKWVPVTVPEMKAFVIVILNMGLVLKPTIKSYWSTSSSQATTWFNKMFSRTRFESILSFFHLVDNSKLPKPNEQGYDPCQKFQPLEDHCNIMFKHYYTPHQQVSIDETLIGTKNQSQLQQYLPNKHHHRWGIKMWVLCDSVSKYCMSFFCYKGAKSQDDKNEIKEKGLAYTVVSKLLTACNLLGKGYHVFTDNFFSSIPLVQTLYEKFTFLTGTLRRNRKGLPNEVLGKIEPEQKVYCKNYNTVIMAYRHKKSQKNPVLLISSAPEVKDVQITKTRRGRETTENKPAIVHNYNCFMGGIDHFDMMLYGYIDERRTVKYWKKVVFNLFGRMVLNAYILYKENCSNHNIKPISRYQFIVHIIESLGEEWINNRDQNVPENDRGENRTRGLEKLPDKKEKTCWVCTKKGKDYNKSRKKTRTVCSNCKEGCHPLCLINHKCK